MKPNFALSLSFDGISLLHRRFPGWTLVDEVSLDTDNLNAALSDLHDTATALDPSGLRTKLVIPNDQIKYLSVPAGAPDAERDTVRKALDGATPYTVDELVFDWTRDGDTLHIAAVAHETLSEAEAFASDHAFAPVSFVAIPEKGSFGGEPFFGLTDYGRTQIPLGTEFERDTAPIRIIGVSKPVQDKDNNAPVVPAEADPDAAEPPEPAPPSAAADAPAPAPPEEKPATSEPKEPDPAPTPPPASKDEAADEAVTEPPEPEVKTRKPTETTETPDVTEKAKITDNPEKTDEEADESGKPLVASGKPAPSPVRREDTTPPPDAPQAFTSIRASRDDVPGVMPKLSAPSRLSGLIPPTRDDGLRPGAADTDIPPPAATTLPSPGAELPVDTAQMAAAAASLRPDPEQRLDADAAAAQTETVQVEAEKPRATFFSGRKPRQDSKAPAPPRRTAVAKQKAEKASKTSFEDEKQRMTIFGARQQEVGGKPRFLGLILTAVLLLFLVGVAAWASIFLDDGLARLWRGADDTQVADMPPAIQEQADATSDIEAVEDTEIAALEPQTDPAPQESAAPVAPADETGAADQPDDTIGQTPPPAEELTPDAALSRYAATGIWQMAPDAPAPPRSADDADRLFDVSLDPDVQIGAPDTLPESRAEPADTPLPEPGEPPPAGVTFDFDENGLVHATPEGAETPSGITVYAALPSRTPPAQMQREDDPAAPEAATETPPPPTAEPEAETSSTDPAPEQDTDTGSAVLGDPDSPLAEIRPRPRPASLTPETTETDTGDDAALDPETADGTDIAREDAAEETPEESGEDTAIAAANPAHTGIRPRARPASAAEEPAEQAAEIDQAALDDAVALATEEPEEQPEPDQTLFEGATPQAVSASLTPNLRPSNFAAIVKRAQDDTAAQPVATAQVLSPRIPSSTSVAREATTKNAIKLRDVNLIGVYGSPKSRRALVRLANGRYKKVKVGDPLDGGKVAAIGDSELRYVKRGRNVTLRIPKG